MCGLFGVASVAPLEIPAILTALRAARDTLIHRGPDSQGDWFDAHVYVGHTRLSILDLSTSGAQPMLAGGVAMAANGEIYNFRQLRDELASDCRFVSGSDSEVLLHGYRVWGIDGLVARIEGMYAFVIYDSKAGRVHLVRDRVGIKPLYYAHLDGTLVWASELKAIEAYAEPLDVDYTALYDFLTYRYIPAPKSLYRQVRKLEPGCLLSFDCRSGRLDRSRYWTLRAAELELDNGDPTARIRALLEESVRSQQVSDAPLGFFLSGGIDSSTVVGMAAADHSNPHTFSIGFDVPEHSELHYASLVAKHANTRHSSATLHETDAVGLVAFMRKWFDEPYADTSALPTFLVSRLASQAVKVVLTGDGGDELFAGYDWYAAHAKRGQVAGSGWVLGATGRLKRRGGMVRRAARGLERYLFLSGLPYYTRLLGGMIANEKTDYRERWEVPDDYDDYWYFRQHYHTALPLPTRLQVLDFHTYLPDDVLTKVDRVSMANSLEARVPFLATPLIEALFALPASSLGRDKRLLQEVARPLLPPAILDRRKQGFGVPAAVWNDGVFDRTRTRQENLLAHLYPEFMT